MTTWRVLAAAAFLGALAGCDVPPPPTGGGSAPLPVADDEPRVDAQTAVRNFVAVVERVEPVAERMCREANPRVDCDYQIAVDRSRDAPPNAFQTVDAAGRPIIGFTLALIAEARNQDELAFILGHEAAHHVEGHIPRTQQSAATGAILAGALASLGGADAGIVRTAQDLGATVGARRFSKGFELEADSTGARIALRAGYDPVRGARFFTRIPDPGNVFLGSHPPNADRVATVERAVQGG